MVIVNLFTWWYSEGYRDLLIRLRDRIFRVWHFFSVDLLFMTLFSPWKQIISYPGKSIQAQMRALVDNLVSRLVGFCVRTIIIIAAIVTITLTAILGGLIFVLWPVAPVLVISLIIWGLIP